MTPEPRIQQLAIDLLQAAMDAAAQRERDLFAANPAADPDQLAVELDTQLAASWAIAILDAHLERATRRTG